jgi:uncharacterized membrane protein YdbT with pleckstrin-like domain
MIEHRKLILEMTPEGEFRESEFSRARALRANWVARIAVSAAVLAVVAGAIAAAALAFWVAMILLPVAIIAGLASYAMLRFQFWRARRL